MWTRKNITKIYYGKYVKQIFMFTDKHTQTCHASIHTHTRKRRYIHITYLYTYTKHAIQWLYVAHTLHIYIHAQAHHRSMRMDLISSS